MKKEIDGWVYMYSRGEMRYEPSGAICAFSEEIDELEQEISSLKQKLNEATGCLALYLEAEDMMAKISCDNGTKDFFVKLENETTKTSEGI